MKSLLLALLLSCGFAKAQSTLIAGADSTRTAIAANVLLVKTNGTSGLKLYGLYIWNGTNSGHYALLFDTNATPGTAAVPSFPPIFLPPLTNTFISLPAGRRFVNGLAICTSTTDNALTNSSPVSMEATFFSKSY